MALQRFDIYLAELEWRNCRDRRPVVILSPQWYLDGQTRDSVLVSLMSSALDLFDDRRHFLVPSKEPEFKDTGLKRTSYVAVDYVTYVDRDELGRRLGGLAGRWAEGLGRLIARFLEVS